MEISWVLSGLAVGGAGPVELDCSLVAVAGPSVQAPGRFRIGRSGQHSVVKSIRYKIYRSAGGARAVTLRTPRQGALIASGPRQKRLHLRACWGAHAAPKARAFESR